jgi:hypothetical protein
MKRMDKAGQQMTLGTIIAIVLGIAVLVFLIFGFSSGWNNMWSKVTQYGGGDSNVDDVVRGCELACTGNNKNAYCVQDRIVNFADDSEDYRGTCSSMAGLGQVGAIKEGGAAKPISVENCPGLC